MKTVIGACLLFLMAFWSVKGQSNDALLFGHWELVGWYDDVARDINKDGHSSVDLFSQWHGCKKQSTLVLSEDHSGRIVYTGAPNNPKCPPDFKNGNFFSTDPWELMEGNILRFIGEDYDDIYGIVELNVDSLILKGSQIITCCDADISYFTGGYLKFRRE